VFCPLHARLQLKYCSRHVTMHEVTITLRQAVLLSVAEKLVKCFWTQSRTAHLKFIVLQVACYCFTWSPKCAFRHIFSAELLIFIGAKKKFGTEFVLQIDLLWLVLSPSWDNRHFLYDRLTCFLSHARWIPVRGIALLL